MQAAVEANTNDDLAQFSLGVVQFLQAIEGLGQDQYRYGLLAGRARAIPFMRLPIGANEDPAEISYLKARRILQNLIDRLATADETPAAVKPSGIKLSLKVTQLRLDLNGDGTATGEETIGDIIQAIQTRGQPRGNDELPAMTVTFDDADVIWLRGYCRILSAMAQVVLAYDWRDQFERTAHLFYPKVDSPYEFLEAEGTGAFMSFGAQNILDLIA